MLNFIGITQLQFVYTENDEFGGERLARSQSSAEQAIRSWMETAEAECALLGG
jgi:FMN-dependent NADH-azoreductase